MTGHPTTCDFPDCPEPRRTKTGMCELHRNVRVSGSWVDDGHTEGGHG